MKNSIMMLVGVAGLAAASQAQVSLTLLKTISTASTSNVANAEFVGNRVSAIAWNGTDLYVAGYNNTGAAANTGIAKYSNALGAGAWNAAFGQISTSVNRGFSGLAISGNNLAAAWDNGAGNAAAIRSYDATTGAKNWFIGDAGAANDSTRRGSGGVAFEPGFGGSSPSNGSVATAYFGSGRRVAYNGGTGAAVYTTATGMIINTNPASTTWRDIAFDGNGDVYLREGNRLVKAVRTGENSAAAPATAIGGLAVNAAIDNQNLAIGLDAVSNQKFIVLNDRTATGAGQAFASVIKFFDVNGTALSVNWNGFAALAGNGAYDFAYDAGSKTLAISDFANQNVYIFAVPTPGAAALLGLGGLVAARRRRA